MRQEGKLFRVKKLINGYVFECRDYENDGTGTQTSTPCGEFVAEFANASKVFGEQIWRDIEEAMYEKSVDNIEVIVNAANSF